MHLEMNLEEKTQVLQLYNFMKLTSICHFFIQLSFDTGGFVNGLFFLLRFEIVTSIT